MKSKQWEKVTGRRRRDAKFCRAVRRGTAQSYDCGSDFRISHFSLFTFHFFCVFYFSFFIFHFSFAQDAIPQPIFLDANGNVISPHDGQGLWQPGSGNDEFGQYHANDPLPIQEPQDFTFPLRQQQEHSPGGKNSYFSGWSNNGAVTSGRTKSQISGDFRNGIFQKIAGSVLWSPKSGSGKKSLGLTQLELHSTFAFPMFTKESPLLVTPGFSTWFFSPGESQYDDSLDLYSANCEFRWIRPLFSQYAVLLGAAPGYHGAFQYGGGNGFRVPIHIGGLWNYNPRTQLMLGCAWLDRTDYNWLPFGGLIWEPDNMEVRFELLFPNPKIAKRVRWWGSAVGNDVSDWVYAAGELAGDCWALKNDAGQTGTIAYRDYRLMLGYERKATCGLHVAVEAGGLFARNYRDSITGEDHSVDSGFFLRVKARY